jgi:protocatechuate 3,4-dioxygenase beta subunit
VFSDAEGRFAITGVAPGRYSLTVTKPGFVRLDQAARVDVAPGAAVSGIELRMLRAASIAGRIVDENGEALAMANVSVETRDSRQTREVAFTLTDDLGE